MVPDELALGAAVLRILVAEQLVALSTATTWIDARATEVADYPEWLDRLLTAKAPEAVVAALREVPGAREHRFLETGPFVVRALRAALATGLTPALALAISHQAYLLVHPVFHAAWPRLKSLHALAEQALALHLRTLEPPTATDVEVLCETVVALLDDVIAMPTWDEDAEPVEDRYDPEEE